MLRTSLKPQIKFRYRIELHRSKAFFRCNRIKYDTEKLVRDARATRSFWLREIKMQSGLKLLWKGWYIC
jgi:hypothetical protein